ncbi:serine hydrolase [Leptobacterium flavescens]|uniref:Serine hydrolase n=1 Tax=Leptobacterium flavescens TaxID=472055 RepID=A0A6P0UFS8_9FLAO|nr:serine hydrolase domain-containing protein [Leptobacterium flavescens]NER12114.1 serine hydrolase [Leptobacterium flavescens]
MKLHLVIYSLLLLTLTSCGTQFTIDNNLPLEDKVDKYFTYLTEEKNFHGVVLISKEGKVLINKGYGSASDKKQLSMKPGTILDIGSITKPFTSTAIMKLVEEEVLDTEQKIINFFQNVPVDKQAITVHQLLTHTSGLPSDFADDLDTLTKEQALQKILSSELVAQPGEKYEYSNTGYAALALIIEKVTNQSYHSYVRDSIFSKLNMNSSGFYGDNYLSKNLYYTGYMNNTKTDYTTINASYLYGNTLGNGGVLSTADDMLKWINAVTDNFFSSAIKERIFSNSNGGYGYGWVVNSTDYGKKLWHDGGGLGGNSYVAMYPEKQITIIILSNRITYRTVFGIPVKVLLPADEAGKQIMENMMSNDFTKMPKKSIPGGRW